MPNCAQCTTDFQITPADEKIHEKMKVPAPKLCLDCRNKRRLAFRNESSLYKRSCDSCKKEIISLYSADKNLVVYCPECWWGDGWSPLDYGQDFDFNSPFADQLSEVLKKVPLLSNMVFNSVNCEYNSFCVDSKNCYQSVRIGDSEDILYSYLSLHSKKCVDIFNVSYSQDLYECVDCTRCNNCFFAQNCQGSSDCYFSYDLIGCKNCFGSSGLRNAEYYFFNQKCTKEKYEELFKKYYLDSDLDLIEMRQKFYKNEILKKPVRSGWIINSENAVGNYIYESKDIYMGYDIEKSRDVRHSWGVEYSKDVYDCDFIYYGENCYENISNSKSQNIKFSVVAIGGCSDLLYSMFCFNNTKNAFGGISLNHQEYVILNKQYTKTEYETLAPKIIEHMKKTGEWGEFFPTKISPFKIKETVTGDYYPEEQKQEEAKNSGEYETCKSCSTEFKFIDKELTFYKEKNLKSPVYCPRCRHLNRINLRNPRNLFTRVCNKCGNKIQTTYSPDCPETVYCEKCYLKEVY